MEVYNYINNIVYIYRLIYVLIRAHNTNANCHTSYICSCAITDANCHTSDICSCAVSCLPWSPPSGCNDQP